MNMTGVPPLNMNANKLYSNGLDSFFKKLQQLKAGGEGVVRIVHIGDSHIQADYMTSPVRVGLQAAFGNAGRGLVFPYQVARTNSPADIISNSNSAWRAGRLAQTNNVVNCGISGFYLGTGRPGASIQLSLNPKDVPASPFKHLKIFTDPASSWLLRTDSNSMVPLSQRTEGIPDYDVLLTSYSSSFSLNTESAANAVFYGASLESDMPGVLYSSIGVNGARYDQYNNAPLFWQQLPALNADLIIISMGTNEAQALQFDAQGFKMNVDNFLAKIKIASPGACILISTAMDSYRSGRPNKVLQQLNNFLYRYTSSGNIALWDLYRVTLGYSASRNWIRKGLMNADKVHFTKQGYIIQGNLLLQLLLNGYNAFVQQH